MDLAPLASLLDEALRMGQAEHPVLHTGQPVPLALSRTS